MCISSNISELTPRCFDAEPVPNIEAVDGWSLLTFDEIDRNSFPMPAFIARRGAREIWLDVSPTRFTPSQARFAWLVRHGFPLRPHPMGGWDDTDLELRLAGLSAAA